MDITGRNNKKVSNYANKDCFPYLIYIAFFVLYIIFFSYLFNDKVEVIILFLLFLLTLLLNVKLFNDLIMNNNTFLNISSKKFNLSFLSGISTIGFLFEPIVYITSFIPFYIVSIIGLILLNTALAIFASIISNFKSKSKYNEATLPFSGKNKKKVKNIKILIITDIILISILTFILVFSSTDSYKYNYGLNFINTVCTIFSVAIIIISSIIVVFTNDIYNLQDKITDAAKTENKQDSVFVDKFSFG